MDRETMINIIGVGIKNSTPELNQLSLSKRKNTDICFSKPIWYHKVPYTHTLVTHTQICFVLLESVLNLQSDLNFFQHPFKFDWTYKIANLNMVSLIYE